VIQQHQHATEQRKRFGRCDAYTQRQVEGVVILPLRKVAQIYTSDALGSIAGLIENFNATGKQTDCIVRIEIDVTDEFTGKGKTIKKLSQNVKEGVILNLFQDLIRVVAFIGRFRNKFGMTQRCCASPLIFLERIPKIFVVGLPVPKKCCSSPVGKRRSSSIPR